MKKSKSNYRKMTNIIKCRRKINKDFFKKWSPNMAYILGFTCADGNLYKTTLSWELTNKQNSNLKLLKDFQKIMETDYPIKERKNSYRLRISNSEIIKDIQKLGIIPNKCKILEIPNIPKKYIRHFIRGFIDGDGWIAIRKKKKYDELTIGFSNGSKKFSLKLKNLIEEELNLKNSNLRKRTKISKKEVKSELWQLDYYSNKAVKLIEFLFDNLSERDICLGYKYEKQLQARELFEKIKYKKRYGRKFYETEKKYNINLKEYLYKNLILNQKFPIEIANQLNVSLASIYRWL